MPKGKPGKSKRPPSTASPAVQYAADRAEAHAEGKDPEAVPMPKGLGPKPFGMHSPEISPEVVGRIRAEVIAEERAKADAAKARREPVRFTRAIEEKIIGRLTEGESLRSICRDPKMPTEGAVRKRALSAKHEPFGTHYARARETGYLTLAEDIVEISDKPEVDAGTVARDRLRVDSRKWILAKMRPDLFGDKLTLANDKEAPFTGVTFEVVDAPPQD